MKYKVHIARYNTKKHSVLDICHMSVSDRQKYINGILQQYFKQQSDVPHYMVMEIHDCRVRSKHSSVEASEEGGEDVIEMSFIEVALKDGKLFTGRLDNIASSRKAPVYLRNGDLWFRSWLDRKYNVYSKDGLFHGECFIDISYASIKIKANYKNGLYSCEDNYAKVFNGPKKITKEFWLDGVFYPREQFIQKQLNTIHAKELSKNLIINV